MQREEKDTLVRFLCACSHLIIFLANFKRLCSSGAFVIAFASACEPRVLPQWFEIRGTLSYFLCPSKKEKFLSVLVDFVVNECCSVGIILN